MMLGVSVFGYIVGTMTTTLSALSKKQTAFHERVSGSHARLQRNPSQCAWCMRVGKPYPRRPRT